MHSASTITLNACLLFLLRILILSHMSNYFEPLISDAIVLIISDFNSGTTAISTNLDFFTNDYYAYYACYYVCLCSYCMQLNITYS